MTTEEIYRANLPRSLGEWAFQGFPGRSKRLRQARELATEGQQQRISEEQAVQDIIKARAAEMLKLQTDARERLGTQEHLQSIRRGDLDQANALGLLKARAQLEGPMDQARIDALKATSEYQRDLVEARKDEANARGWALAAQALRPQKRQPSTRFERLGDGSLLEIDDATGAQFGITSDPATGEFKRQPIKLPPIGADVNAGSYLPPRADVSTQQNPIPVRAGDELAPVAKPGILGRAMSMLKGLGGGGAQNNGNNWDGSKSYNQSTPVNITEPVTREQALAEQPTVFQTGVASRMPAGGLSGQMPYGFFQPRPEDEIMADLYTANRRSMMPDSRYLSGSYVPGRSRILDRSLQQPSKAFRYLQSLYQ